MSENMTAEAVLPLQTGSEICYDIHFKDHIYLNGPKCKLIYYLSV